VSLPSSANLTGLETPATPAASPAAPTQKPGTNIYTVMLILSFLAIVTACIILAMELNRFGAYPWWATPG
jgi:hypothetical protein